MLQKFCKAITPESDQYLFLDALRFIAAMAIVFFHFRKALDVGPDTQSFLDTLDGLRYFVDVFFVISGFVIAAVYGKRLENIGNYGTFMQKRIARLAPLHWLTLLAYISIWLASIHLDIPLKGTEDRYEAACIVPNIFFYHTFDVCNQQTFNYVSWSISAEMGMYVLAPVFLFLARWPGLLLSLALTTLAILSAYSILAQGRAWYDWSYDWGVLRALPAFMFGVFLFKTRSSLNAIKNPSLWALSLLSAFLLLQPFMPAYGLVFLAYAMVVFAVAADTQRDIPRFVSGLAGWGQITYSSYMIHPLMLTLFVSLLCERILGMQGIVLNIAVAICFFLVVPVSVLSLVLFENPARLFLSKWHSKRPYVAPQHP